MNKIPVFIDTDPGVDDAFAIMMAKASQELEIKGMSAVAGNVGLDHTLKNTLGLCQLLNIQVPIYKGAKEPMVIDLEDASEIHGAGGLGNYQFENIDKREEKDYAWDGLYKIAKENKGELTIIALGPLTNIALAILKYPDLPKYVKKLIIMGGNFKDFGNTAPYSEFNFWADPHAAQVVIKSELETVILGLDCTRQATLTQEEFKLLDPEDGKINKLVSSLLDVKHLHLPDAVAMAAAIKPEIFTFEDHFATCITDRGITQGWSIADDRKALGKEANTTIGLSVDKGEFIELLLRINTLGRDS